ncbi:MAG: type II secretion system protein M [Azoarcus sp.]|jgi:general secretion pathway protein M|nr:type II secretion system protein M [Azoarcus sp.]
MMRVPFTASSLHRLLRSRAALAVGLSVLVVLVPVLFAVGYLMHQWLLASAVLEQGEPRLARLMGLRNAAQQVRQAREVAESALLTAAYSDEMPADRIGTDLQQRLRTATDSIGVAISGSQVIEGKTEDGFEQIVVAMSFEASHGQLQQLLQMLAQQTPTVYVDSLTLAVARRSANSGRLLVQARFCVLRQAS